MGNDLTPTLKIGFTPLYLIQHFAVCCLHGPLLLCGKVIAELCADVFVLVPFACSLPSLCCLGFFCGRYVPRMLMVSSFPQGSWNTYPSSFFLFGKQRCTVKERIKVYLHCAAFHQHGYLLIHPLSRQSLRRQGCKPPVYP